MCGYVYNINNIKQAKMSIIIKSDQLNILIYKYLLQSNLSHTAYTLYNEANLDQSLNQYKFNVKSGHLVSLLQHALIFNQIQSHITMSGYQECKQSFYLLKSHVCKIVEKVKQQKDNVMNQLNQKVFQVMRRTCSIHNVLQPNKEFQEIIYQQRSANFFDRIPLKLANSDNIIVKANKGSFSQKYFCAYDPQTLTITALLKKQNFLHPIGILPCQQNLKTYQQIQDLVITTIQNQCEVAHLSPNGFNDDFITFKLPLLTQCTQIKPNRKIKHIITFQSVEQFVIINLNTKRQLASGKGVFQWIDYFDYLVYCGQEKIIRRFSLKSELKDVVKQFMCPMSEPSKLKVALSEIYFSVQSAAQNKVLVYNFDQPQPLYIFDFKQTQQAQIFQSQQSQQFRQAIWITANSTDNLILLTDVSIKTFQIQLNNFSKIIQISSYDNQILYSAILKKNQEQMYLVCLGLENMIFYDVSLGKIERVQFSEDIHPRKMFNMNQHQFVGIQGEDCYWVMQATDVAPLFL